ncbi:GGDEF domain-containing protein [Motiliproteus coralliicola]|uniref:GGDEF domain-containing protein n=1 Tax=Motiliproteus coralliicola TaxID=2283196 RepID=UPI000E095E0F|nr:GGDEF domain-containing protein [Motiliproteus coralliicola]
MTTDTDLASLKKQIQKLELQCETDQADLEALGRVTVRLCLATKGLDSALDDRLEPLQERLKNGNGGSLISRTEAAEKGLMNYFQQRDRGVQQTLDALRSMLTLLWQSTSQEGIRERIDKLIEELPDAVENFGEYPRLLTETSKLQATIFDRPNDDAAAGAAAGTAGGALSEETQEQLELVCNRVGSLVLDMLGQLSIPAAERAKARTLMKRIEEGFEWQQLPLIQEAVVELVLKAMVVRQEDFENYLESLNHQLGDIQGFLVESREHQQAHRDSSQKLDLAVRSDVSKVEHSLVQAESLDQLKTTVRSQLADIVKAVDQYRSEQEARELQVESRLEQLQDKLETMEEQSVRMQAHLEEQRVRAVSDPLTGLPNRGAYSERMETEFSRWKRYGHDLTMVVCDLDHFKRVNDNYGHLAGDKVLKLVAKLLTKRLRESDFVARFGGEEFVVLMPETDAAKAQQVVEVLRKTVAASPFNFGGKPVQITMSFGIAGFHANDETHEEVFQRADDALYQAKEQGRNRSIVASR